MRQHIAYICSADQAQRAQDVMKRLSAKDISPATSNATCFELKHALLENLILQINFITELNAISSHLRQNPVDLLIYDERGPKGVQAQKAIPLIKTDVSALAELWGPDFLFPMSRVVAVVEENNPRARRIFDLGALKIRDILINPSSTAHVLRWIKDVLSHGILRKEKVGMALSGGGIEGFLYQVGALYALEQALEKKSLQSCKVVSGVSSGAIAGALFASGLPIQEVIRSLHHKSDLLPPMTSATIFDLAGTEISKRVIKQSLQWKGTSARKWLNDTLRSIPTGFFKGENLEEFFRVAFESMNKKDSFQDMQAELFIGGTDQDSFEHVIFGQEPWDGVKVSEALRASCALPPVFLPKKVNGRYFIDGQVTRTCNLELIVNKGCRLVIIINPLKPHGSAIAGSTDQEGGLHSMIQTIKALVSSRFESTLKHLAERYPDVDFVVFEPDEECAELMSGSPMRYKIRTQVIKLAYKATLRTLRERHQVYSVKFGKYGMKLASPEMLKTLEQADGDLF